MSGITHEWNGTILTITSDSGTSSMDLKGATGDDGIRGPQGPAGRDGNQGATIELDTTLENEGMAADAKAVGDAIAAVEDKLNNLDIDVDIPVDSVNGKTGEVVLTAEDVGALPANTVIPSTTGLASESYVDDKISAVNTAINKKQNKVFYSGTQPTNWVNGDIWLKPQA